jgi:Flp pilus assembly protein TadG
VNVLVTILRRLRVTPAGRVAERGSATIFVVAFSMVLFAGAGLAIDGGRIINERDKATDVAEQAARAGADQLDQGALRNLQVIVLDQDAAKARADSFVRTAGYAPTTRTTARSVTVRATTTYKTVLLNIVGINSLDVSGTATASQATEATNGATP